jgi:hypothetical protein
VKQLLLQPTATTTTTTTNTRYRFILGARDVSRTQAAYDALRYDSARHSLTVLPLELSDLRATRSFAQLALQRLRDEGSRGDGGGGLDYLLLNAAVTNGAGSKGEGKGSGKTGWCESLVVNHLCESLFLFNIIVIPER